MVEALDWRNTPGKSNCLMFGVLTNSNEEDIVVDDFGEGGIESNEWREVFPGSSRRGRTDEEVFQICVMCRYKAWQWRRGPSQGCVEHRMGEGGLLRLDNLRFANEVVAYSLRRLVEKRSMPRAIPLLYLRRLGAVAD